MSVFRRWLVTQFGWPRGAAGRMAGAIMASRPSNRIRNTETIRLLDIAPNDVIVEIGCGPGLGVEAARRIAQKGCVIGIDRSSAMLGQTRKRLQKRGLANGTGTIKGDARTAISLAPAATRIFGVNVAQFIEDRSDLINRLAQEMPPEARLAFTYQPRERRPTQAAALKMALTLEAEMSDAGLIVRKVEIPLKPVSAWCVIGEKPVKRLSGKMLSD